VELLHEADVALYSAKNSGRDQVCFFAPVEEATLPFESPSQLGTSTGLDS